MTQVLKPGGTILLYDMFPFSNAASAVLRRGGFTVRRLNGLFVRAMKAGKPLS